MVTNMETILSESHIELSQTVYEMTGSFFLRYPLYHLGLVEITKKYHKYFQEFPTVQENANFSSSNIGTIKKLKAIKIRGIALVNTVDNIVRIFPQLDKSFISQINIPIFSYNLIKFAEKLKTENSAIEGGPCIIGVDEVFLTLIYKDGSRKYFDIMTGCQEGIENQHIPRRYDIAEIIANEYQYLLDIDIYVKRCGPTVHQLIEIYRLILIAKLLDVKLIIGLPDEAYRLSLLKTISPLKNTNIVYQKWNIFLDMVVDKYLKIINQIQQDLKFENLEILHSRNGKLIKLLKNKIIDLNLNSMNITNIEAKKEAIMHYSCMPALPYLLWKSSNILEVNSVIELESLKSAIKLFPEINYGAITFPFIPDLANCSSMYHGKNENKIFIDEITDCKEVISLCEKFI